MVSRYPISSKEATFSATSVRSYDYLRDIFPSSKQAALMVTKIIDVLRKKYKNFHYKEINGQSMIRMTPEFLCKLIDAGSVRHTRVLFRTLENMEVFVCEILNKSKGYCDYKGYNQKYVCVNHEVLDQLLELLKEKGKPHLKSLWKSAQEAYKQGAKLYLMARENTKKIKESLRKIVTKLKSSFGRGNRTIKDCLQVQSMPSVEDALESLGRLIHKKMEDG